LNVAAMLIAFIALVACLNWLLGLCSQGINQSLAWLSLDYRVGDLSLERLLGWVCAPLAWVMGIEWKDAQTVGMLLGKKLVLNEFLAYADLVQLKEQLSPRSMVIATYALCGFANFGSVAIQIGGVGALVPSRRPVFARYGLRAMIGGALTTFMTATIAGMLL
jgi:CNT family concentrative nucleoside transporter